MDENNGLEAEISNEKGRITKMMDLQETFPHVIRISLQVQTSHMGITVRTMEDHLIIAQISHSIEAIEIDPETDLSIIRMGPGKTTENSLALHRLKGETSDKMVHIASQGVINLTIQPSTGLTFNPRQVLQPTNKNFHKTITGRLLIWFPSQQPMIPSMNYQTFAR